MRQLTEIERKTLEDCNKRTWDDPCPPTRVNIIFHGLLAFRDLDADHYEVLIPITNDNCHEASYGNPCLGPLTPFPQVGGSSGPGPAYFAFEGIAPEPPLRRSFPNATNTVIIKNSLVTPQYGGVRTVIKVPKPLKIRHYRGGETHLTPLAGDPQTSSVLLRNPDVLHEITVFSYLSFFQPRLVGMGDAPVSYKIPQPNPSLPMLNIGIYCQPKTICMETDDQDFNAMFNVNPGTPLNLQLNGPQNTPTRVDDGPPIWTSYQVGISVCELLALSELDNPLFRVFCQVCGAKASEEHGLSLHSLREFGEVNAKGGIPGGCGSGFSCDDGQ